MLKELLVKYFVITQYGGDICWSSIKFLTHNGVWSRRGRREGKLQKNNTYPVILYFLDLGVISVTVNWSCNYFDTFNSHFGILSVDKVSLKCVRVCMPMPTYTLCGLSAFQSESEAHYVVTVSCSYCSPLPPFLSRKETRAMCVCVCVWHRGCVVCVYVRERTSGLTHIILNRIFPSRVLLPLSFRSLPQDSRLSTNSPAVLRADCLFWSVIVPEPEKPWVSIAVTPPTCHALLNY